VKENPGAGRRAGYPQGAPLLTAEPTTSVDGMVVRTEAGYHRVLLDDRTVVCRAPKRLLTGAGQGRRATTAVVIGDRVRIRLLSDGTGLIEEILPRANELVRGAAGGSRYLDVIAANLDLLVAVHSFKEPDFNPSRLDRYLVMAEAAEIQALVCLNKLDLIDAEEAGRLAEPYRAAGYPVILTCAPSCQGVDELRDAVIGKVSALVGPSGVGKSSLLNDIQPGLQLRTGHVSEATGKGRHTTTTAELLALSAGPQRAPRGTQGVPAKPSAGYPGAGTPRGYPPAEAGARSTGGWIADTPGLRELAIRDVEPEDAAWLFPEFRPYLALCRFSNCSHREELGCAIRRAVEQGSIGHPQGLAPTRYRSYLRIFAELAERRKY
jgi:ribosome biogenesis GTPase / thiamine phosphate phosphatase